MPISPPSHSPEVPSIPLGTHFHKEKYLYAFATRHEVFVHIRTQSAEDESSRLSPILDSWESLQPRVHALTESERGLAEAIQVREVPSEYNEIVREYTENPVFKRTFTGMPVRIAMVEIDKLVAPQRGVNLDYVETIVQSLPKQPSLTDILKLCIGPSQSKAPIQHIEVAASTHVFSSPSSDLRFLGSFKKPLTAEDLSYALQGGVPAAAIIFFVGYGASPVNAYHFGSRVVLQNGFHRVYALRSMGVAEIPVVVHTVRNPTLELPPVIVQLPREYLLNAPRPVLLRDFFNDDFTLTLRVRERIRVVGISNNSSMYDVPA